MKYSYTTVHPNKKEVVHYNKTLSPDSVLKLLNDYPWNNELILLNRLSESEIYHSPSIEIIENSTTNRKIIFSAIGNPDDFYFLVFYDEGKLSDESGEVNKIKANQFLELFLSGETEKLLSEMNENLTQQMDRYHESNSTPKWVIVLLNFFLILIFGSLSVIGIRTGSWQISLFFGSIMLIYGIVFLYFNGKTK